MLIDFRVENYLSLRDEQHLSLVASADKSLPDNLQEVKSLAPLRLVRSAAIYGANASGKSNVLWAIQFLRDNVLFSHTRREAGEPIPVDPFRLDGISATKPSFFAVDFIFQGVRTEFGCIMDANTVHEEWLYNFPRGRRRLLYSRDEKAAADYRFGPALKGENRTIARLTRPNSLFLSAAAQNSHEQLSPIYKWFRDGLRIATPENERSRQRWTAETMRKDEYLKQNVLNLLKEADTGILDLEWTEEELPDEVLEKFFELIKPEALEKMKLPERERIFKLVHEGDGGTNGTPLSFNRESEGTKRLFGLAGPIFDALRDGTILVVDELEASMHHLLTRAILKLFHSTKTNMKGAQLIFTTHDTNLLDQEQLLRRDQIWFTRKDATGATTLYPLSDYKPRRGESLAKAYLRGRYGAVPVQGEIDF